jgi:hypothetical protein
VVSFTPRPFYPQGKSPWYPLDRRPGGPRAGLDAVVKRKIPSPCRDSNPDHSAVLKTVAYQDTDFGGGGVLKYKLSNFYIAFHIHNAANTNVDQILTKCLLSGEILTKKLFIHVVSDI